MRTRPGNFPGILQDRPNLTGTSTPAWSLVAAGEVELSYTLVLTGIPDLDRLAPW